MLPIQGPLSAACAADGGAGLGTVYEWGFLHRRVQTRLHIALKAGGDKTCMDVMETGPVQ